MRSFDKKYMKTIFAVLSALLLAIIAFFAYVFDQWLGVVAFTYPYLFFCAIVGLLYWAAWYLILKKRAMCVGLAAFALLALNFLLPPPSERILRSALLRIPQGTSVEFIERIVKDEYNGSGYALPQITKDDTRVHVSLLSRQAGNCTAIIFKIEDGIVVDRWFVAD